MQACILGDFSVFTTPALWLVCSYLDKSPGRRRTTSRSTPNFEVRQQGPENNQCLEGRKSQGSVKGSITCYYFKFPLLEKNLMV